MRAYLWSRPASVVVLVDALFSVAILTGSYTLTGYSSVLVAFGGACFTSAIIAPFMVPAVRRQQAEIAAVTGPLTSAQRQAVLRAAGTGVAPTDPALLRPAADLARYRLDTALRTRTRNLVTFVVLFAFTGIGALLDHAALVYVGGAVLMGALAVATAVFPARQTRRVARLDQAVVAAGPTGPAAPASSSPTR